MLCLALAAIGIRSGVEVQGATLSWGLDAYGQLGTGTEVVQAAPTPVDMTGVLAGKTITAVATGARHTLALTSEGKVYSWGEYSAGQLGTGSGVSTLTPVAVVSNGVLAGKVVVAIAAGSSHSLALTSDGKVYGWGLNSSGQLGTASPAVQFTPVAIAGGDLAGKTVSYIAAGESHSLAVTTEGKVVAWGLNSSGQLGDGSMTTRTSPQLVNATGELSGVTVVAVAAGRLHSLALSNAGLVYAWGGNSKGQLGDGSVIDRTLPVRPNMSSGVLAGKSVSHIAGGDLHTVVCTTDGQAFTWGYGAFGQLGRGSVLDSPAPVAVVTTGALQGKTIVQVAAMGNSTAALSSDGGVFCWGQDSLGQCGAGAATASRTAPVQVITTGALAGKTVAALASSNGRERTMIITSDGQAFGWGHAGYGQLGSGVEVWQRRPVMATGAVAVGLPIALAAGQHHSLALFSGGKLYTWGTNSGGLHGNDSTVSQSSTAVQVPTDDYISSGTVTAIAAGTSHSLAITSTGRVYAWGSSSSGQCGTGTTGLSFDVPQPVLTNGVLAGKNITAVAGGLAHTLALSSEGRVYAWGSNASGELGNSSTSTTGTPVAVDVSGELAGKTVIGIAAGSGFSVAITSDGGIYTWGSASSGRLGDGSVTARSVPGAVTLSNGQADKTPVSVAAGDTHCLVVNSDGTVYGWGSNGSGQLGLPSITTTTTPVPIDMTGALSGKVVVKAAGGLNNSLLLTADGKVFAMGATTFGALGNGASTTSFAPVDISESGALAGHLVTSIACGINAFHVLAGGTDVLPVLVVEQPAGTGLATGATRSFGQTPVGQLSSLTFTVRNQGVAALPGLAASVTGADAADFSVSVPPAGTVAVSESTTFTVRFAPAAKGTKSAVLNLTSSHPGVAGFTVNLEGIGVYDNANLSALSGAWLSQGSSWEAGTLSPAFVSGSTDYVMEIPHASTSVTLTAVVAQQDATVTVNGKAATSGVGSVVTDLAVGNNFIPVVVTAQDGLTQKTYTVNVFRIAPAIAVSRVAEDQLSQPLVNGGTVALGEVDVLNFVRCQFQITNPGAGALHGLTVTKTSAGNPGDFELSAASVPSSLGADESANFSVTFSPQAVGGRSGTIRVASENAVSGDFEIHFSAEGMAPRLVVKQAGVELARGASLEFTALLGRPKTVTLELANVGSRSLPFVDAALLEDGSGSYTITGPSAASIGPNESVTMTVTLTPASLGPVTGKLRIAGSSVFVSPFDLVLTGTALPLEPQFQGDPEGSSQLVKQGSLVALNVAVSGDEPMNYQWRKTNPQAPAAAPINLPGANAASYVMAEVQASDAGVYSLRVNNGYSPAAALVSPNIYLAVIASMPPTMTFNEGKTLLLTCNVTAPPGVEIDYEWSREEGELSAGGTVTGATAGRAAKTLKISGINAAAAARYRCRVQMKLPNGNVLTNDDAAFTDVQILEKPVLAGIPVPPAYVAQTIEPVAVGKDALNAPTSYACKGLPAGAVFNTTTGVLSGKPKAAKIVRGVPVPYVLTFTASNAAGTSDPVAVPWLILSLPNGAKGSFSGLVEAHPELNGGLGGTLKLTTTSSGAFSGDLKMGSNSHRVSGSLDLSANGLTGTGTTNVNRKGLPPLAFSFTIDTPTSRIVGSITDEDANACQFEGWRSAWSGVNRANHYAGYYTAGLLPAGEERLDPEVAPSGDGYATLKVTPAGMATWAGKLPDGTALTGAFPLGPNGQVAFHGLYYGNTGSAQGWQEIDFVARRMEGEVSWYKGAQPVNSKSRNYTGGFDRHSLRLVGGVYLKPLTGVRVVDMPHSSEVVFSSGGLSEDLWQAFELTDKNTVVMPANEHNVKLTLTAATGLFSGSFVESNAPQPGQRQAKYAGIMVQQLGRGVGHFLLPTQGGADSPILSGAVSIEGGSGEAP